MKLISINQFSFDLICQNKDQSLVVSCLTIFLTTFAGHNTINSEISSS